MGKIEELAGVYRHHISAPWQRTMAGAQRVMMVVYEKEAERALRARLGEFEQATRQAGHGWKVVDCTTWFADWMAADEYRESYFENPPLLTSKYDAGLLPEYARRLSQELEAAASEDVVALVGTGSVYGFFRLSGLLRIVEPLIHGRLVVFFPGTKNENNYRLLDARDGFNYLAQAITLHGGGATS